MKSLADFSDITLRDEPLAPHTWMKIGGPAQYYIKPRTEQELIDVVRCCHDQQVAVHILGGGSNLLVRDEGVSGAVLKLEGDAFSGCAFDGCRVTIGAGMSLSHAITLTVKQNLAGFEVLSGIPGTIGGALHGNAGGKSGDIGQFVKQVRVLTSAGEVFTRREDELSFAYRTSSLNELIMLDATFELYPDVPDEIERRMRKIWIMKKATQPLTFQSAGCIFKNPRGMSAGLLIDQARLKGTRIGGAEVSDRHANFIVAHSGASSQDVLRLIDLIRSKVAEQFGIDLELEIKIW
ncbi:MAG: UDP-N-acetylmuramate dehydrogenase [Planctomycetales bacterium]|nr:UDP-N-acetylmuramate dehydrogenase [Planctomycetales bacterium]